MNLKTILLYGLFSLFVGTSAAQSVLTDQYNMTCLDLSTGLPHNNVNQVFADSQGFIWISTYGGGVVRYDGYSFNRLEAKGLMVSNSSKGFAEDGHRRLWVAFDEGINIIDLKTMRAVVPDHPGLRELLTFPSMKCYRDAMGRIWVVNDRQVSLITFDAQGQPDHIYNYPHPWRMLDIAICDVDGNGKPWIGIDGGLYRLVEKGGKLVR